MSDVKSWSFNLKILSANVNMSCLVDQGFTFTPYILSHFHLLFDFYPSAPQVGGVLLLYKQACRIVYQNLCVTFLNFQARSNGLQMEHLRIFLYHVVTLYGRMFSTSKSWLSLMLTFMWHFWTFDLSLGQMDLRIW